ncbi:MAG: hypothetical protein AAF997_12290, partial [Myxococcota bacterium]
MVRQIVADQALHRQVRQHRVELSHLLDAHDVRRIDGRGDFCLARKPRHARRLDELRARQQFDGGELATGGVRGLVDLAHCAAPQNHSEVERAHGLT